jgi:ABC-type spermidine/putrescine transport system permease subunit II
VRSRHLFSRSVTAVVLLFLYAPIVLVVVNSFNADRLLAGWGGFTTDWYSKAFGDDRIWDGFAVSITIGVLATALSVVIAVAAGLWWRGASQRARRMLDLTTYVRLIIPEVVAALALFALFRKLEIGLGMAAIVIGHVVFTSAFATIVIQARCATLPGDIEDAAADLGARPHRVLWRVTLPMLRPAIAVAALLSFTFSFDNFITSQFLAGTSTETLPMLIYGLVRFRITPEVNAVASGAMAVTVIALALAVIVLLVRSRAADAALVRLERDE